MAGDQSDNGEEKTDRGEGESVGFADTEKLRSEEPCKGERKNKADPKASQCEAETLSENEPVDVSLFRAQRHADADFTRTLARGVSHNAVDADSRKQHREKSE
jgi:hypothetical protein